MVEKESVITPSVDRLLEITSSKCTVTGCGKAFRNSSELRCHMAKSHREGSLKKIHGDTKIFYACPANNCVRNAFDPRKDFFPSMYRLRKVSTILFRCSSFMFCVLVAMIDFVRNSSCIHHFIFMGILSMYFDLCICVCLGCRKSTKWRKWGLHKDLIFLLFMKDLCIFSNKIEINNCCNKISNENYFLFRLIK